MRVLLSPLSGGVECPLDLSLGFGIMVGQAKRALLFLVEIGVVELDGQVYGSAALFTYTSVKKFLTKNRAIPSD
jgi:hypothetical protein